jgi:WD40 repeat protein
MALSGSDDMTLIVWELNTLSALHRLEGHAGKVECCNIFARGRFALSGSSDGTIRVWNLITGKQTKEFEEEGGHEGAISCCQPLLERYAISGGHDRTCRLWHMSGKSNLTVNPGELITAVARKKKAHTDGS